MVSVRIAWMACLFTALPFSINAGESSGVPDGSFVRISVIGGVSPFRKVAWDVTLRGDTTVVTLVKESVCRRGQRQSIQFLDLDSAPELLETLHQGGVWELKRPARAKDGGLDDEVATSEPKYEFWVAWGRRMERFWIDQKDLLDRPELVRALGVVRDGVDSRVKPLPVMDVYHDPATMGWVQVTATEKAVAVVDGWQKVRLPAGPLEMVEGEHTVAVRGLTGRTSEFKVRVVAGTTNQVHVVLK